VSDDLSIVGFDDDSQRSMALAEMTTIAGEDMEAGRNAFGISGALLERNLQHQDVQQTLPTRIGLHQNMCPNTSEAH